MRESSADPSVEGDHDGGTDSSLVENAETLIGSFSFLCDCQSRWICALGKFTTMSFVFSTFGEIVHCAPRGQAAHLTPVVYLVSGADETHHCCVVRKLD